MSDSASAASEPIAIAEQDALGRADFARRVAQTLVTPDGKWARKLVLGLVGPWGSGKTSVLNLVEQALGQREPKPAVVRFNPWVVSGRDDLLRHLLLDIAAKLDPDNPKAGAKRFLKTAKPYLNALSVAADVHVPGAGGAMRRAVGAAQAALTASPPLAELKGAVEQALRGAGRPVIVFIDDIDRLTDAEVRVIAQIVRAVADFDNVAYLLAYDQQRVEEALGAEALGDIGQKREYGRRYLEKLVNLALRLPQVEHETAAKFLGAAVLAALQDTALRGQPTHARDMKFLIANLVRQVLVTPRDQLRAAQALAVYAGMFGEDVDTADLLAFAALEVRFPALAECIRTTPNWRAMADGRGDHVNRMTETLATHPNGPGRWQFLFPVEGAPVPGEAKSLISWMFPTLFGAENDFSYQLRASRWNGLQGDGRLTALLRGTAAVIEVPAARIRACICNDEAGALDALRAEHKAGTLAQFLDALRRPSSDLPGARIEWLLAMANFLEQTPRHEHGLRAYPERS